MRKWQNMGTSVGIAVVVGNIVQNGIHYRKRPLGGGSIIEINNPVTVDFGLQNREIFSD